MPEDKISIESHVDNNTGYAGRLAENSETFVNKCDFAEKKVHSSTVSADEIIIKTNSMRAKTSTKQNRKKVLPIKTVNRGASRCGSRWFKRFTAHEP